MLNGIRSSWREQTAVSEVKVDVDRISIFRVRPCTRVKQSETVTALRAGASETDMVVLNIGARKAGRIRTSPRQRSEQWPRWSIIYKEGLPKVILETGLLRDEQKWLSAGSM